MRKEQIGTNPDGSPHWNYILEDSDGPNPEIVATGRGMGLVQTADGTLYDVTEAYIVVDTPAHAADVVHEIGAQVEKVDPTLAHTDCPAGHCDAPVTAETDPLSPQAKEAFVGFYGSALEHLPSVPDDVSSLTEKPEEGSA